MFKSGVDRKPLQDAGNRQLVNAQTGLEYPHRLNFYDRPPLYDVTLEEFEVCALDRLRILAEIESSAVRNRTWEETTTVTEAQCNTYLPLSTTMSGKDTDSQRRKDHLGHFILRLAFCRSEELRRRFLKAETTLFKMRYETDTTEERNAWLSSRNFNWVSVDPAEKARYEKELFAAYQGSKISTERQRAFAAEKYCKVRWTRVPDLIEKRRVFLKSGWAYVPGKDLSSIIFQEFETNLEKALELTTKALPRMDEDTRLIRILENLSKGFLAGVPSEWTSTTTEASGEITADMIDDLAREHFPMCMRTLHDQLQRDRHLKHFGRLQYGLFLKVLGLSIEEAIAFWRKSFSRITDDKFNKEYKYNIRHSYGLEGKRANYPAKSCQQLLTARPDEYGCPYRNYSPDNLQSALLSTYAPRGLQSTDLPEIMNLVKTQHYHIACTRVFELTHARHGVKKGDGVGKGESITHPNQYAAKSIELEKAAKGEPEDSMVIG